MYQKFKFDLHTHTVASGHAYSTVTENASYAEQKGLELLGISDHAPKMPGGTHFFYFLNFKAIPDYLCNIRILKGVELNILDINGKVDLQNNILKRLDYAIASLHIPCIEPMELEENTQAVINTIKKPYINIIGHLCDPRYPIDIRAVVTAARDNNTLLEINNSSLDPRSSRAGGDREVAELIKECKRQGLPVILGSDAHFHMDIGNFNNIIPMLEEINMPDELIINTSTESLFNFLSLKSRQ